ncbi:MAG TPA: FtsX-like permease family protein [Vicinamibacterales bacterium]
MLRAVRFAWLSLVRQPARSILGVVGVTAIGALLFDMLLLSRGLVLSFGDLLERSGFDVRVLASEAPPFAGPRLTRATALAQEIAVLPGIEAVLQLRLRGAELVSAAGPSRPRTKNDESSGRVEFIGADPRVRSMWTIVEGQDLPAEGSASVAVVNRQFARHVGLRIGSAFALRGRCGDDSTALPPVTFTVSGIAEFPFDSATEFSVAGTLADADRLCGQESRDTADMLLVRSSPRLGSLAAAAAIRAVRPGLYAVSNEELVERFSRVEFSYFRQISAALSVITLFFGFLLIAALLTVSVNQRLAEIAALRAIGLSRSRVAAGVVVESILLVGIGGALAVPVGAVVSVWLDAILRTLPGLPVQLHFFVFEPRAVLVYGGLLAMASIAAAVYPARIVSVLPIAATLRSEVVS